MSVSVSVSMFLGNGNLELTCSLGISASAAQWSDSSAAQVLEPSTHGGPQPPTTHPWYERDSLFLRHGLWWGCVMWLGILTVSFHRFLSRWLGHPSYVHFVVVVATYTFCGFSLCWLRKHRMLRWTCETLPQAVAACVADRQLPISGLYSMPQTRRERGWVFATRQSSLISLLILPAQHRKEKSVWKQVAGSVSIWWLVCLVDILYTIACVRGYISSPASNCPMLEETALCLLLLLLQKKILVANCAREVVR